MSFNSVKAPVFLLFVFIPLVAYSAGQAENSRNSSALEMLQHLIRIDTSQPQGNEILAASYIKNVFDKAGIESELFESAPGRTNIVARIRGNGSKRPLLLLGHTDVVTVEPENWAFPPFSARIADGKIYGRGAADDKCIVAASMEVLLKIKHQDIPMDRDVIFLGVADEEGGGTHGITYMVSEHFGAISAEFALNEGSRVFMDPATRKYVSFGIGTAEKTPRRVRLTARGEAGHGSVPTQDNVIARLARAVTRLEENPLPMRLNETTYTYFSRLAANKQDPNWKIYREILEPTPSLNVQNKLRDINLSYFSIIRTSVSPTIFESGYQRNVIPSEGEVTLDIRALPDEDPEEMLASLRNIIDDPYVEIIPMKVTRPAHSPAPLDNDMFRAFEKVIGERHPDAMVLPIMLTGATDSAQLRAAGIPTYGFGPGIPFGESYGAHGNNEYLYLDAFAEYQSILWDLVMEIAASRSEENKP